MQHFITDNFQVKQNNLVIFDERVVHQLRKVLRAKIGYTFSIQNLSKDYAKIFFVKVKNIEKKSIVAVIQDTITIKDNRGKAGVAVSFLNKFSKMELIVQKLTELAITDIIFFPSDYSVFKIFPDSKVSRLKKIMVEAAEQSRNYFLPNLVFLKSFDEIFFTNFKNFYWGDFDGEKVVCKFQQSSNLFIVGPEGGFSKKEIETLQKKGKGINLGNFILRAETAAIVGAWLV